MKSTEELNRLFSGATIAKMQELTEKIKGIDLDSLRSDTATLAGAIRDKKAVGRRIKQLVKKPKRRLMTKAQKRKYQREYKRAIVSPALRELRAEMWESGDTWGIVTKSWKARGIEPEISQEDWMELVHPHIVGSVFSLNRYDRTQGWSLENIYVVDTKRTVLWDGKEYSLRKQGYCL